MSEIQENPYAPGVVQKKHIHSEVEAIRHRHLPHEAALKSMGVLYLIGGAIGNLFGMIFIMSGAVILIGPPRPDGTSTNSIGFGFIVFGVIVILYSVAQLVVAIGFRKIAPWVKDPGMVIAGAGLLVVPIGTLLNIYVLYLLLSKKGTTIFSPEYKDVICQTPYMKHKTPIGIWIVVCIFLLMVVAALFNTFA